MSELGRPTQVESLRLGGIDLTYTRAGPPDGEPLVVLHGGAGPGLGDVASAAWADRYQVIEPIHPGFAGTPIPDVFDGMDDLAYLYLDFLEALDLGPVVLMGFSMGGWAALEIAVRNLTHVRALVLVDSVGIKPGGREDRDIADVFALPLPALRELAYHDLDKAPDLGAASDSELAILAADRTALALYTWEPYMHNPKLAHRLHRALVPSLVVWGDRDRIVSPDYGRALSSLLPQAELRVVQAAGHHPHLEQPRAFWAEVERFVQTLP